MKPRGDTETRRVSDAAQIRLISDAFAWLGMEQPESAILSHHGISCVRLIERFHVRFTPIGAGERPVFIFEVNHPLYLSDHLVNPFTHGDIFAVVKLLELAGVQIFDCWNGEGFSSASFSSRQFCGVSLRAAVNRYHHGCLVHPKDGVFCECDWLTNGYKALRLPENWS